MTNRPVQKTQKHVKNEDTTDIKKQHVFVFS